MLTPYQKVLANEKIKQGVYVNHGGTRWIFSKHAVNRLIERGEVTSSKGFEKCMKKIEKSMNKGRKITQKDNIVIIGYWKIVLDLYQRTIITVFRMY